MRPLLMTVSLLALAACDLSPDWQMPTISTPAAFKEQTAAGVDGAMAPITDGKWKRFDDKAKLDDTAWWTLFNDPVLDALQVQAMKDNPTLDAAIARVQSAREASNVSDSDLYPQLSLGAGPVRQKPAVAGINGSFPAANVKNIPAYDLYQVSGRITYDIDLFGRVRNSVRSADLNAAAQEQRYRAARLGLQADLAQAYFAFAAASAEEKVLKKSLAAQEQNLKITRQKRDAGEVDDLVLGTQETELANAQQSLAQVQQTKALQEHLLAILTGQPPAAFTATPATLTTPPRLPATLPGSLLERRPDLQAAADDIAAANARIGVARAGYFPDISLTATGGFTSNQPEDLFKWSSRTWALGPLAGTILTQPVFQGGRVAAQVAQSKADYQEASANYRASVLTAFREVEDQLSSLNHLSEQAKASSAARKTAAHAFDIASMRFKVGYSSYLEYLDAQRSLLNAERSQVQVAGNRYIATVQLIRALGGRWDAPASAAQATLATSSATTAVTVAAATDAASERGFWSFDWLPDAPTTAAADTHSPALAPLK